MSLLDRSVEVLTKSTQKKETAEFIKVLITITLVDQYYFGRSSQDQETNAISVISYIYMYLFIILLSLVLSFICSFTCSLVCNSFV